MARLTWNRQRRHKTQGSRHKTQTLSTTIHRTLINPHHLMEPKVYDLEERLTVFAAHIVINVGRMPTTLAGRYYA